MAKRYSKYTSTIFKQIFGIPSGPDEVVGLRCFRALKMQPGVNLTESINVFCVPTCGLMEGVAPSSFAKQLLNMDAWCLRLVIKSP